MPPYKPSTERLLRAIVVNPTTGCWLYSGSIARDGYGKMNGGLEDPSETLAHRISFKVFVGPIPDGCEIDHKCKTRGCVRPEHLQAIPHSLNVGLGDYITNHHNRVKTHCKRGHEFTTENTIQNRWGQKVTRKCRVCYNVNQRKNYAKCQAAK